jgi:hypothetical protein
MLKPAILPILFGGGVATGAMFTVLSAPVPHNNSGCGTYLVSHKVATSYALKPPSVPEPEPKACPPVQKCEAQVTQPSENVSNEEITNADDTKQRHHRRHRRYRHYWR